MGTHLGFGAGLCGHHRSHCAPHYPPLALSTPPAGPLPHCPVCPPSSTSPAHLLGGSCSPRPPTLAPQTKKPHMPPLTTGGLGLKTSVCSV